MFILLLGDHPMLPSIRKATGGDKNQEHHPSAARGRVE
jgi:hypothetical protein